MATSKNSIFDFADKFGIKSLFPTDWIAEEAEKRAAREEQRKRDRTERDKRQATELAGVYVVSTEVKGGNNSVSLTSFLNKLHEITGVNFQVNTEKSFIFNRQNKLVNADNKDTITVYKITTDVKDSKGTNGFAKNIIDIFTEPIGKAVIKFEKIPDRNRITNYVERRSICDPMIFDSDMFTDGTTNLFMAHLFSHEITEMMSLDSRKWQYNYTEDHKVAFTKDIKAVISKIEGISQKFAYDTEITSFTPIEGGGGRIPMQTDTRTYVGYIREKDQAGGITTYRHPILKDNVIAAHLILFTYKISNEKIVAVKFSYFGPTYQAMLITNPSSLPKPYPYEWQK